MNVDYEFEEKWNIDTPIEWWNECRTELNKIIDVYNQWQLDGFKEEEKQHLVANITFGMQTIGQRDGGSGYLETLEKMMLLSSAQASTMHV